MTLIDRYILQRFFVNFVVLFTLLFIFAVVIDIVTALDKFVDVARDLVGEDASKLNVMWTFIRITVDFESPRFFQFYAYLHGLVAIGAMGFTLSQMHRHGELTAILAAGLGMHRIAMPFIVAVFALSMIQLVNQELFLPRVAPLLIRDHEHAGQRSVDEFAVPLTPDARGNLFQSPRFDPRTGTLTTLTVLERDDRGRTIRRITADEAVWSDGGGAPGEESAWILSGGHAVALTERRDAGAGASGFAPVDRYPTNLSPSMLLVRRHRQFAAMLSLRQIEQMLATPGVTDRAPLLRHRYARFASVFVNILVMWMALPAFLLREPANLLRRTVYCAAVAVPSLLGAALFMVVEMPGIPPAVGVFLPALVLIPLVLAQWTYVRS